MKSSRRGPEVGLKVLGLLRGLAGSKESQGTKPKPYGESEVLIGSIEENPSVTLG